VSPVQVLTVDDQPVFLEAARALITSTPGFALAGEATSGAEAIRAVERLHPDLVLLDVRMPGLDGIETARWLTAKGSDVVIVLVTGHDAEDVETLAEHAGAVALVAKERLRPKLLRELWASHGGCDES
jgi:two-component system, NarL family, invasion response regulator UvrY